MKTLLTIAAITATFLAKASGTFSLIEINPLQGSETSIWFDSSKAIYGAGELSGFTELNGRMYFSARNSFDNDELWSTDGTQNGLSMVKEINPTGNSYIGNLVKSGNKLLFMASDNGTDFDLWSSDGTTNGTIKIADMNQTGNTTLTPQNISTFGNRLIFCSETQLMITDGTSNGTEIIMPITQYAQGFGYCELNDKVYFLLPSGLGDNEIWRTDGSTAGTEKIVNLSTTPNNIISVTQMVSFNGKIYVIASRTGQGNNLFTFDGNVNGQLELIDLASGGSSYPSQLTLHNGALYFSASTMTSVNMYRITNGNAIPQELLQNPSISWFNGITFANNSVYFLTETQQDIHRIDLNSLAHSVTHLHGYNMPFYWFSSGEMLVGNNGQVFFAAYDSTTQQQLFFEGDEDLQNLSVMMPPVANTVHPFNMILSCGMADVFDFKMWGNKVIVPANFNNAGRELWIYESNKVSDVDEVRRESTFAIYPNPVQNELFVKTNNSGYCEEQVVITNILGETIKQISFTGGNTSVNVSQLQPGNYCITLRENGIITGTKKFVIAK